MRAWEQHKQRKWVQTHRLLWSLLFCFRSAGASMTSSINVARIYNKHTHTHTQCTFCASWERSRFIALFWFRFRYDSIISLLRFVAFDFICFVQIGILWWASVTRISILEFCIQTNSIRFDSLILYTILLFHSWYRQRRRKRMRENALPWNVHWPKCYECYVYSIR